MLLARFDVHDIADRNLTLVFFGGDFSFSRRDDENLIVIMDMPASGRADSEVHYVAAEIVRLPLADNRLPRPAHRTTRPPRYRCRRIHWLFFKLTYFEYAQLTSQL